MQYDGKVWDNVAGAFLVLCCRLPRARAPGGQSAAVRHRVGLFISFSNDAVGSFSKLPVVLVCCHG